MNGALSLRDILVQAFYNRWIIATCLLFGLFVGLLGAVLSPSYFTAESLLLIRTDAGMAPQSIAAPGEAPSADAVKRILESDIRILQSEPVLRATIERLGIVPATGEESGRRTVRAVEEFRRKLHVTVQPDTNIIRIAYENRDRATAIRAVAMLVQVYGDQRSGAYLNKAGQAQEREIRRYADDLRSIETQIQDVRAHADVLDIRQDIELASNRLDGLGLRASQSRERLSAVEAELAAAAGELSRTPAQVLDSRESTNARANDEARNTLLRLKLDRQHLLEQYTPEWPGLRELDRRIAAAEEQLTANGEARSMSERFVRNPIVDQLRGRMAALRMERQALLRQLADLDRQMREAGGKAGQLRTADQELRDLQRTRDVIENIYRQLSLSQAGTKLQNDTVDDSSSSVRIVQPATAPTRPSSQAITFLIAGILLGIVGAVIASGVATLIRQVFITPREAERALRLPALADVPRDQSNFRKEAGRAAVQPLTSYLMDGMIDDRPLKIVRIAGTDPDERSGLALAIARCMAGHHRQGTLLLDLSREGHLRQPLSEERATGHIPLGGTDVPLAESEIELLWMIVEGGQAALRDSRIGLADLRSFMDHARAVFDRIVIIGDDDDRGQYLTRRNYRLADANLLIVRAERTRAPAIQQLRDTILAAGGDLLGFVYTGRKYHIPGRIYRWL
ncbi:GumC family protein [Sphingomonas oleivorans]|nr:Wzz/FepE/Etk N-terminal domain-containing protein [Sphingomonas oleivorans]